MPDTFVVPDGLDELEQELPSIIDLIARTARWVHPDTFRALPVWYPETARGQRVYDAKWGSVYTNTSRSTAVKADKFEANIQAAKGFVAALGTRRKENWTVCHIWSVDDPKFQKTNTVVRDRRFYSCIGNMVWLPTPLKAFTDAVPSIRRMLRICAFHMYDWACEHADVASQAAEVRSGQIPDGYPVEWPAPGRNVPPPGTAPFSPQVAAAIARRKETLRRKLGDVSLRYFPREEVREVLEFWKIDLPT
jgi:hypothetical protein